VDNSSDPGIISDDSECVKFLSNLMVLIHCSNFSAPLQASPLQGKSVPMKRYPIVLPIRCPFNLNPMVSSIKKRRKGERSPRFVSPTYWWGYYLTKNSSIEVLNPPRKDAVATEKGKPAKKRSRPPQPPKPLPASPSPVNVPKYVRNHQSSLELMALSQ
jgi:hypothetical protein